ncbi:hypothetical protein Lfu02_73140 [Longispora fulva]|uniref:Uncharacterized protein n=1 Tax=Longispora fulva TaxID=619741 RepID=A0A8J7GAQ6_9ACTN|nr:hypothetical protein [Longispora fulva]MBG6133901.1 hypothetical protein [Longispora fulva]GIG62942.1 hypothetical protein Lfu02_73140 [Longispora fulva]
MNNPRTIMLTHVDKLFLGRAAWAASAVTVQANRILAPDATLEQAEVDAMLLLYPLRQVLRAAEVLRRHTTGPARELISDALDRFHTDLPGVKDARDVLEHFDEYLLGAGRLQKRGQRSTGSDLERADAAAAFPVFSERRPGHFVLHVGPLSIDVATARSAAQALCTAAADAEE